MSWARPPKLGPLGRRTNSCSQFFTALLGLLGDAQNDWQTSAPLVVETPSIGRLWVSAGEVTAGAFFTSRSLSSSRLTAELLLENCKAWLSV